MNITISVKGRFHAFFLAEQLQNRHCLQRLITSYPKFKVAQYGVYKRKVKSLLMNEVLERLWNKRPKIFKNLPSYGLFFNKFYDKRASHHIPSDCDIFIAWADSALYSFERLNQKKTIKILECGTSHILNQKKVLSELYDHHGWPAPQFNPEHVKRVLCEYELADFISIPSTYVKNSMLQYGIPEEKLIITPYGVNNQLFSMQTKNDATFRIIFCGNATLRKGLQYLLQAFHELQLPNSELWIIGAMYPEMDPYMKKYKADNIIYKGKFPEFTLPQLYSQGSIFCLPSVDDGFGMVVTQAMGCGLPVITSENTGASDLIEEGKQGYVLRTKNVELLKEKISFLFDNPEITHAMGRQAAQKIQENYSWKHYGDKIFKHFDKLHSKHLETFLL